MTTTLKLFTNEKGVKAAFDGQPYVGFVKWKAQMIGESVYELHVPIEGIWEIDDEKGEVTVMERDRWK